MNGDELMIYLTFLRRIQQKWKMMGVMGPFWRPKHLTHTVEEAATFMKQRRFRTDGEQLSVFSPFNWDRLGYVEDSAS